MTQDEITAAIDSIYECHALLLTDKDRLTKSDLKKANDIINSLLGEDFHSVANSLLQMHMNRENELAKREAEEDAQCNKNFMDAMLGITDSRKCLGW
jgi:hypothetical protein